VVEGFQIFRYAVLAVAGVLALAGFAAMAVQRRTISPFSGTARAIRRATDPLLKPLERRLIRTGRNPQSAPTWLVGIALVAGILVITLAEWLVGQVLMFQAAGRVGGGTVVALIVEWAFRILIWALIVRVIGSWVGATRYTPLMRPFYWLTDWMIEPLRRVVPPFGPIDVTPLVAWLLLVVLRSVVFAMLQRL
jgi:YggT family protein